MRPKLRLIPWLLFLLSVLPAVAAGAAAGQGRWKRDSWVLEVLGVLEVLSALPLGEALATMGVPG
jgi:hypothetical protein